MFDHVEDLTIEQALGHFLDVEGQLAYLPLDGWTIAEHGDAWGTFEHTVGGRTKAIAFLSTAPEAGETRWTWSVAACDPAEFDPTVAVTNQAEVWTDGDGRRVPFSRVGERSVCGGPATFLLVDGHAYAIGATYSAERVLGAYAEDVAVPADARQTGYRRTGERIWLAADGRAAYIGSPSHASRLPRIRGDDTSVTDCN